MNKAVLTALRAASHNKKQSRSGPASDRAVLHAGPGQLRPWCAFPCAPCSSRSWGQLLKSNCSRDENYNGHGDDGHNDGDGDDDDDVDREHFFR